ncbi:ABC transporter substrate-binding protein [Acinetobacter boissieri]|uniref:NitT/TauT family transport system ATP-binding protein n=1 Tax=Acinetobacter boissieri TaxID=1219383 RepID=A0A1G6IVV1_9GAMM|nr:ABC transporter substrate-binding protein [Acinetobacter boissieri]SDC09896.1 NitT/TauT family transport system ATP-binding protein [Acinetobacter boissieri]
MHTLEKTAIQLGYIPLLDCIAILWAKQRGFFEEFGLDVTLVKEASWASLRDRLAFGVLDAAHCLSAMLPAAAVGTDQIGIPLQTPLVLSINRAFISLNQSICFEQNISASDTVFSSANKLVQLIKKKQNIHLAHVFKHSIHHYCIKEWLSLADMDVAQNLQLMTCPPPYMIEAIQKHTIDGFCVGEPWNIQSQVQGYSQIIAESKQIIPEVADKVLAVTQSWAKDHPHTLAALTHAISKAQYELQTLDSFSDVWKMLKAYHIIQFDCSPSVHVQAYYKLIHIIQNFTEQQKPKVTDFEWIIQQMCKWENLSLTEKEARHIATTCIISSDFI